MPQPREREVQALAAAVAAAVAGTHGPVVLSNQAVQVSTLPPVDGDNPTDLVRGHLAGGSAAADLRPGPDVLVALGPLLAGRRVSIAGPTPVLGGAAVLVHVKTIAVGKQLASGQLTVTSGGSSRQLTVTLRRVPGGWSPVTS